jgi:hypothetical protein
MATYSMKRCDVCGREAPERDFQVSVTQRVRTMDICKPECLVAWASDWTADLERDERDSEMWRERFDRVQAAQSA